MSFNLRRERFNRGLTQSELARLTGIDRGTIIRLERGGMPLPGTALKIAQWLETTPDELWPVPEPERSAA